MDKKEDASAAAVATEPEEGFKFSDLGGLFKTTGFRYVAFLCLMFYAGVFPFLKFATKLMIFKYGVDANLAGLIPAMLPFDTIFLTPLFGSIYDKYGKGATLMIIGSCLLTFVHVMFALPINSWVLAIVLMLILGIAFGLIYISHVAICAKDYPNETLRNCIRPYLLYPEHRTGSHSGMDW